MRLTKNFSLEELLVTETGLPNQPNSLCVLKLLYLATYLLQPTRNKFGRIKVPSGYRSSKVNKAVGGSSTSQHLKAEASDIISLDADINDVWLWMAVNLKYGQLINEEKIIQGKLKHWIHVSLPRVGRRNQMPMFFRDGKYCLVSLEKEKKLSCLEP